MPVAFSTMNALSRPANAAREHVRAPTVQEVAQRAAEAGQTGPAEERDEHAGEDDDEDRFEILRRQILIERVGAEPP